MHIWYVKNALPYILTDVKIQIRKKGFNMLNRVYEIHWSDGTREIAKGITYRDAILSAVGDKPIDAKKISRIIPLDPNNLPKG